MLNLCYLNGDTFISQSESMKQARVRLLSPPEKLESGIHSPTFPPSASKCAISKLSLSSLCLKCSFPKRRYWAISMLKVRLICLPWESLWEKQKVKKVPWSHITTSRLPSPHEDLSSLSHPIIHPLDMVAAGREILVNLWILVFQIHKFCLKEFNGRLRVKLNYTY